MLRNFRKQRTFLLRSGGAGAPGFSAATLAN